MEQHTKFCSNCEKEVPESKFVLHERCCVLNMKKCTLCKEVINIEDEQEHIKEFHIDFSCQFCSNKYPKQQIAAHIETCSEKPIECQYCRLQVPFKEKGEHEYSCGAKTEICPTCKKYIPIKEYDLHNEIGCCQDNYLNNNLIIEKGKPKPKLKPKAKEKEKELKQKIEYLKKEQVKAGNTIHSSSKIEASRNEGVQISSVKVEIPQHRLDQMQKLKVEEKVNNSNTGMERIVKKIPYTKRTVDQNNPNSTNNHEQNDVIINSNVIPDLKIIPDTKNQPKKNAGIRQNTGDAITKKNNQPKNMKSMQNEIEIVGKDSKKEKVSSKKGGKKNKFTPIKIEDDFLPEDDNEESAESLNNVKNKVIESKVKPKKSNPVVSSVEDDILQQVIETSKNQK